MEASSQQATPDEDRADRLPVLAILAVVLAGCAGFLASALACLWVLFSVLEVHLIAASLLGGVGELLVEGVQDPAVNMFPPLFLFTLMFFISIACWLVLGVPFLTLIAGSVGGLVAGFAVAGIAFGIPPEWKSEE